jgi:ketosteroid isomerase-like protein
MTSEILSFIIGGQQFQRSSGQGETLMNRRTPITMLVQALLLSMVLLAGTSESSAQQSDIKNAIEAFHVAISSLDVTKMEPLWAHEKFVMLINPSDKSISLGWEAVKRNWKTIFSEVGGLKVTQLNGPHLRIRGDVAWATEIAVSEVKTKTGGVFDGNTLETFVFEKLGGQWLIVSHTSSRVPM